jgi:hypothetical protein
VRITETMRTQRISVSDLFTGTIARRLIVTVDVPVVRDGESKYVLSMALLPETLARVFEDRPFPADWIVAIFDRNGLTIARSVGAERFVGRPGRPDLIAEVQAAAKEYRCTTPSRGPSSRAGRSSPAFRCPR